MASDQDDVLTFIRQHIRSVWTLEILLLLRRDASRCWDAADIVRELRANQGLVADNLKRLADGGLVTRDDRGCWSYLPATPELDGLCRQLEEAFRERPVTVVNMITNASNPLKYLADAFKFRGDGK